MTPPQPVTENGGARRGIRAGGQVLLLVVLVLLGILAAWFMQAPSPAELAIHAAAGADKVALLELVQRADYQAGAEEELRNLLQRDAAAVNALAELATGHEVALVYMISLARTQPELLAVLDKLEMSYPFALRVLRYMNPAGMAALFEDAETCANAQFMVGVAYENGCHVKQDWEQAAHWYNQARLGGYAPAAAHYAPAAYNAAMAAETPGHAFRLFQAAADCGYAAAQCALGVCYAAGQGVPVDMKQALVWYERSAAQGFRDAEFNLGWCYLHGEGVKADAVVAAEWFRKAATKGDDMAQYYLGRAYEMGDGVPQDYTEAVRWYQWAVEQGNDAAQCALGHCYAQGRGLRQCWRSATHWYKLSAGQGRSEAQLALAYCYENGLGVPQDATAARYWRRCASQKFQSNPNQS